MDPILLILIIGGSLAFLLLFVGLIVTVRSEKSIVEKRLGQYMDEESRTSKRDQEKATPVGDWLDRKIEKTSLGEELHVSWPGLI